MSRNKDWNDQDERPTSPGGKRPRAHSDTDHTVGELMVQTIHHQRRIEVLEERVKVLEFAPKNVSIAPTSSLPPAGRQRVFAIIRKTVTYTVVAIAAIFSALKELGFLVR